MGKNYESHKKWLHTPNGRASVLLNAYNHQDLKYGRGKGDLTAKWIVDHIFTKPCAHCGKEGWEIIGCNRLDNSKPHTKDNVEPCCKECNDKLATEEKRVTLGSQINQINMVTGEIVASYPSYTAAAKSVGSHKANISRCVSGRQKYCKGYYWEKKTRNGTKRL